MNIDKPLALLAGQSPQQFMRRHWHKKPLLVRQAITDMTPLLSRTELFALAAQDGVESRLVQCKSSVRKNAEPGQRWTLDSGPFDAASALPPLQRKGWTLLVQGVDLHHDAAHALLQQFRFVPDARLDDLMVSYATEGGGVGPHFDSYDVFLLQAQGRRRWRIGPQKDLRLRGDVPLKMLKYFAPTQEFVLEPGDMLYLPPLWAHEGVAVGGECQTYSIGFRAPSAAELARELLLRLADELGHETDPDPSAAPAASALARRYRDPSQPATASPASMPTGLGGFAQQALRRALGNKTLLRQLLGETLTEPKPTVWFEAGRVPKTIRAVRLARASRMLVDGPWVFLNGESWRMAGNDARLLRKLAQQRFLDATDLIATNKANTAASAEFHEILRDWVAQGWLHAE